MRMIVRLQLLIRNGGLGHINVHVLHVHVQRYVSTETDNYNVSMDIFPCCDQGVEK